MSKLLDKLSVKEKAVLCSGKDFWHLHGIEQEDLPSIMVTDGPHGLRKQSGDSDHVGLNDSVPATCFPTACGLAATWNRELLREVGVALGRECRAESVSVLLGPGMNIKRHPLGGRNFEYFSEDPYLTGAIANAWIEGVQSQGVGTSPKHYAANNHESGRMVVDVVVDERTLREIYLPAFESVVKENQPWTLMCSYNKINGVYVSENKFILTDILRDQWAYEGMVVTDWSACNDRVKGIRNGQNLEMPGSGSANAEKIVTAVDDGALSIEELDKSVARVIELIEKAKPGHEQTLTFNAQDHHDLARTAAEQACVLLKNDASILPLNREQSVCVIGAMATSTRYQGSGSSQINPTQLEQPLDQIKAMVGEQNLTYAPGYSLKDEANAELIEQASKIVADCDRIVLIAGLTDDYESEGFDRSHMRLPENQLTLIAALKPFYSKLVLVLQNGAPVALPFANGIPGILEAYLGGQAGASALARILFGEVSPSGKLAETFPVALEDIASDKYFPGELRQSQYREGIWVGYRYFDTAEVAVAFSFGHGLSYSEFSYSDLSVSVDDSKSAELNEDSKVSVLFSITNSGTVAAAEVAQLYVGQQNSTAPRPKKELKQFTRLVLQPGETGRVELTLNYRSFAYWSAERSEWCVESDDYLVMVGASSADIRLSDTLSLATNCQPQARDKLLEEYYRPSKNGFSDQAFVYLLGHAIPEPVAAKPYQVNSVLGELQGHWLGRSVLKAAKKQMGKMLGGGDESEAPVFMDAMLREMPLRSFALLSGGKISDKVLARAIHLMNGDWLKFLKDEPANNK